jgi:hypothetical protein
VLLQECKYNNYVRYETFKATGHSDVSRVISHEMNKEPPSVEKGSKNVNVIGTHCSAVCHIPTISSTYYVPFHPLSFSFPAQKHAHTSTKLHAITSKNTEGFSFTFHAQVRIRFSYVIKCTTNGTASTTCLSSKVPCKGMSMLLKFIQSIRTVKYSSKFLWTFVQKNLTRCNSVTKFIISYLYESQHVLGNTPPIIRSLKLH